MARKNPLKTAALFGLASLFIFAISYFVIQPQLAQKEKAKDQSTLLFPDLKREDFLQIEIKTATEHYFIQRKNKAENHWLLKTAKTAESPVEKEFEADTAAVDALISTLLAAKKESAIPTQNLTPLGLQPSQFQVIISDSKNQGSKTLEIGFDTPVDYLVYAKWSATHEIFLTTRSLRFSIDKKLNELRSKTLLKYTTNEIQKIEWKWVGSKNVPGSSGVIQKDEKGDWRFESGTTQIKLDSGLIMAWIDEWNQTRATQFASEDPKDLMNLGLKPGTGAISFWKANEKDPFVKLTIGQKKDAQGAEKHYANLSTGPTIYEVETTLVEKLHKKVSDFRNKKVFSLNTASVDHFTLFNEKGEGLEFTKKGQDWQLMDQLADKAKVDTLLALFSSVEAAEFFDNKNPIATGLNKPQRVFDFGSQGNIFLGRSPKKGQVIFNKNDMEFPVVINLDVVESIKTDPKHYWVAPQTTNDQTANAVKGVVKKMEPTVKNKTEIRKLPGPIVKAGHKYSARIEMQNGKTIEIAFDAAKAPYTVSNFLHLARNHFYDGVSFHRVIPGFMAQGGDPTGRGSGGPGYKFDNEDNDLKHVRGAISMAHAGRNTNGSQFFICYEPQPHLDGLHVVFGIVTSGMEVVDQIKQGDVMKKVEVFEEAPRG